MTFEFTTAGRQQRAHRTWYRGEHCNYNPTLANLRAPDAIENFILAGWLPEQPFIDRDTKITAFGSCFAANISNYLNDRDFRVLTRSQTRAHVVDMGEGIVNSYAILQQFEWAFRNVVPSQPLWHGYRAEEFGYDDEVRANTLRMFEDTDVFILTLGLSEVWYDEPTGEVFWRAVPEAVFDPTRHRFRVTTVAENVTNLRAMYALIREFVPQARIILTLSPIPLVATFRPESCIGANAVSKAVLRAAIDELYRDVAKDGHLFYWPSYEVIEYGFGFGRYEDDRRHIKPPILDYVMALFETHYCVDSRPVPPLPKARLLAMGAAGDLTGEEVAIAQRADAGEIRRWMRRRWARNDIETAVLVTAAALSSDPDSTELQEHAAQAASAAPRSNHRVVPLAHRLFGRAARVRRRIWRRIRHSAQRT